MQDTEQIAADTVACTYCPALPGEWCTTASGNPTYYLHAGRSDGTRLAWHAGYEAAVANALSNPSAVENWARWSK